jgi:excisionase family DNA binding protein
MTETGRKKAGIPGYLTTQEVADRLRVTRRTVYNWLKNDVLEATKAGPKIWLVSEEQLAEFLKRSRPKRPRMVDMLSADSAKCGKSRKHAAAAPAAPASAVQPVPPQKPLDRPALGFADLVQDLQARFGPGEHSGGFDVEFEDERGAYGFFGPAPSSPPRPSIPPANISQKKRGGRRR